MSNTNTNTEQWGNIELPGLSDEKLFGTNWNHVAGIKERNSSNTFKLSIAKRTADPAWREKNARSVRQTTATQKWQDSHKAAMELLTQNPDWQKKHQTMIKNRGDTWRANKAKAMKDLSQDPNWQANTAKANRLRSCKPIITPEGVFESLNQASDHYIPIRGTNARRHLMSLVKKPDSGFYYITQEEYIMLTGKAIE
jgi:hypothetical protein